MVGFLLSSSFELGHHSGKLEGLSQLNSGGRCKSGCASSFGGRGLQSNVGAHTQVVRGSQVVTRVLASVAVGLAGSVHSAEHPRTHKFFSGSFKLR
jgi:hypothetical protein